MEDIKILILKQKYHPKSEMSITATGRQFSSLENYTKPIFFYE